MERVIMLKWFKKLTGRLFGDEVEEIEETTETKEIETQYETETERQRPNFRFPIITDAEIYGWDDDEYEGEHKEQTTQQNKGNQAADYFEPTPLFENERWPVHEEAIVHRTRRAPKDERPISVERLEKSEALKVELESIQKKKRTDRFTPTKVPSPVHGYKMPEKKESTIQEVPLFKVDERQEKPQATEEKSVQNEEIASAIADEKEMPPVLGVQEVEEVSEVLEIQEDSKAEEVQEVQAVQDSQKDEEVLETSEALEILEIEDIQDIQENQALDESSNIQELEILKESQEPDEFQQVQETEEIQAVESVDSPEIVDEKAKGESDDSASVVEQLVDADIAEELVEETKSIDEEPLFEEIQDTEQLTETAVTLEAEEPVFKERIVPFNVLMLKSDKKKLKAMEIANEMQAKVNPVVVEEAVIIEEPPVVEEIIEAPTQQQENETIEENPMIGEVVEAPIQQVENEEMTASETIETVETVVEKESAQTEIQEETPEFEHYVLPTMDYLIPPENQIEDTAWLASQSEKLEESLSHFGVQANVINAVQGPTVTRFELTVGQGTKVSRVRNLADDLKLTLAARDIRIQAPIPGESSIGIEIPNRTSRAVRISEVIETESFQSSDSPLEAVLGLGLTGEPVTLDLRKMPHGMIAGATGSGKSVCINSILVSLLYKASPADLKMMLIDPKMVELAPFNGIPHLISPVITDVKAATAALKWAVAEMERRYELLAHAGVRDIERYNEKVTAHRQFSLKMPYLLIVIDELADLMMMAPADVEVSISRIAQKARACGIHLIIATQRPSVDVITGIIKANIPTRIAFSVSSQVDSRTMIDTNGAERLLGRGDMLYVGSGESTPVRLQGTFVTDDEIERIIEHVQREATPTYLFGQDELLKSAVEDDEDPLFIEACEFIFEQDSASTSMLQRNFSIGYNRAAKLMDRFEKLKFISPQQGSRARDVYLTEEQLNELKQSIL